MTSPLLNNSIDAFTWFELKSRTGMEKCTTNKLHSLLYLTQCYYAVAMDGDKFAPSIFIATKDGAIEPNLDKMLPYTRDLPTIYELPPQAIALMESIWRKYMDKSDKEMINLVKASAPFQKAYEKGENSEILLSDMINFYKAKSKVIPERKELKPVLANQEKPVIMKNENGRAVKVKSWAPKRI